MLFKRDCCIRGHSSWDESDGHQTCCLLVIIKYFNHFYKSSKVENLAQSKCEHMFLQSAMLGGAPARVFKYLSSPSILVDLSTGSLLNTNESDTSPVSLGRLFQPFAYSQLQHANFWRHMIIWDIAAGDQLTFHYQPAVTTHFASSAIGKTCLSWGFICSCEICQAV